jgi:hypothetical protein
MGRRLYAVFIDFVKAFDLVPWAELLDRCARLGFHGSFLEAISQLYHKVLLKVSVQGHIGDPIRACRGTKQGSHLSPLLFGWFIEQIHEMLLQHVPLEAFTTLGQGETAIRVLDLFYADDGTPISCDPVLMQKMLDIIALFSLAHGMEVSLSKTNWVEFRSLRAQSNLDISFTYQGHNTPRV